MTRVGRDPEFEPEFEGRRPGVTLGRFAVVWLGRPPEGRGVTRVVVPGRTLVVRPPFRSPTVGRLVAGRLVTGRFVLGRSVVGRFVVGRLIVVRTPD